jgi:hypothetical protein
MGTFSFFVWVWMSLAPLFLFMSSCLALFLGVRCHMIDSAFECTRLMPILMEDLLYCWHVTLVKRKCRPRGLFIGKGFVAWGPAEMKGDMMVMCSKERFMSLVECRRHHVQVFGDIIERGKVVIDYITEWHVKETPDTQQAMCLRVIDAMKDRCRVHLLMGSMGCGKSTVAKLLARRLDGILVVSNGHATAVLSVTSPGRTNPVVWITDEFELLYRDKKTFNDQADFVNNSSNMFWILTTNKNMAELRGSGSGSGLDASCFRQGRVHSHNWWLNAHAVI